MSYEPNNTNVYLRAYVGFFAGITSSTSTDVLQGDFQLAAQMADAYAQQFDTQWGTAAIPIMALEMIEDCSQSVWQNRSPLDAVDGVLSNSYVALVQSQIARIFEALGVVLGEGINPNGSGSGALARVLSPNGETVLGSTFSPTSAGKLMAIVNITPKSSGIVLTSILAEIVASGADDCVLNIYYIPNLVSVTGGTLKAPGLTFLPTSSTPPYTDPTAVLMFSAAASTFSLSGANTASVALPNLPLSIPSEVDAGIAIVGASVNNTNWTNVGLAVSSIEQP